jgi:adenosylhomocysteine nucleosidase
MSLCVKVGMASEYNLVKRYIGPGVTLLSGSFTTDTLDKVVPKDCTGIISTGLCGGLAKEIAVGQIVICDKLITPPDGVPMKVGFTWYEGDARWREALYAATHGMLVDWWSNGAFNTANTEAERDALYTKTRCAVIDDETFAVAELAARRGIAFQAIRSVSDGEEDNLPPAVTAALNANGTTDIEAVIASVVTDPLQIPGLIKTAHEFFYSMNMLEQALKQVGPFLRWYK